MSVETLRQPGSTIRVYSLPWERFCRVVWTVNRDPEPSYSPHRERITHSIHIGIFGRLLHFSVDWGIRPRPARERVQ